MAYGDDMNPSDLVKKVIDESVFIYRDEIISKEDLLKAYGGFLCETFEKENHNISIVLHTGSICFDIVSIVFAAISNLILNDNDVENVLDSINIGDMVSCGGANYVYKGIEKREILGKKSKYAILEGKSGGSLITEMRPEDQWHLIMPYYGESTSKGSRGRRNTIDKRNKFIEYFTDTPVSEIPSVINSSTVIVLSRSKADEIIKNVRIEYGARERIDLLELATASYYTENDEYNYSGNSGRLDPILKITSKLSVARELVIRPQENKILGLIVLEQDGANQSKSELVELMERRNLGYVYTSYHIDSARGEELVAEYENANLFACTRDFLIKTCISEEAENHISSDLHRQIDTIVNKQVNEIVVDSGYGWDDYKRVKNNIKYIKDTDIISDNKEEFIKQSSALLNVLVRAPFSMNELEESGVQDNTGAAIVTPDKRLNEIKEYVGLFSESIKHKAIEVVEYLETMYDDFHQNSKKEDQLKKILSDHREERIAIIVPKNYYSDVLKKTMGHFMPARRVDIYTANRFNSEMIYDRIIVCGDFSGKRFDAIKCKTAINIDVLLYDFEHKSFNYRMTKAQAIEKVYNQRTMDLPADEDGSKGEFLVDDELETMEEVVAEMEGYLDGLNRIAIQRYVSKEPSEGAQSIDVTHYGRFDDGDSILFSKYYKPIVFNDEKGEVKEIELDELVAGDVIIFTKNDSLTKSIVDEILENLIERHFLEEPIREAYKKSQYWKEALRNYMNSNMLTYDELGRKMVTVGSSKHPVTIRSWIQPFSHIVGPMDIDSYEHIAKLTQDKQMTANPKEYCDACNIIRTERRKILKLIGKSIINSLQGISPKNDDILEAVYENVDNLAIKKQIESVSRFEEEKTAPINMVNKPIQV